MRLLKQLMRSRPKYKPSLQNKNAIPSSFHILKGDLVEVVNGPCTGERGKVLAVVRKKARVVVEGVNVRPRKKSSNPARGLQSAVVDVPGSLHYSNVNLVCPMSDKPTRISRKFLEDGTRVRVSKRSGAVIPRPEELKVRGRERREEVAFNESGEEDVWRRTYDGSN